MFEVLDWGLLMRIERERERERERGKAVGDEGNGIYRGIELPRTTALEREE